MNFRFHSRARCILLWGMVACSALAGAQKKQKGPVPPVSPDGNDIPDATIPLQPLGYQSAASRMLLAGVVTSSLHYVDAHHLLLTYRAQKLIPRTATDDPQGDSGMMIEAVLLEAPSGKVLGRTQWRMYDHGQYLWPMSNGTFLLRKGRELSLLTPLASGHDPDPLRASVVTTLPGQVSNVIVAPDGRMVVVEAEVVSRSSKTPPANAGIPSASAMPISQEEHTTDIQFLQFDLSEAAKGKVSMSYAGHTTAANTLGFPLTGDGHMHAETISADDWNLFFNPWRGGAKLLGDVVSTCPPSSMFLSNREALIVTCTGPENRAMVVVSLDKRELWQEEMAVDNLEPGVRTAPESGRFAMSRILRNGGGSLATLDVLPADSGVVQRIDVRDIKNGSLVATVNAAPIQRAAQNFALSDDGMHLAILQKDVIAIYDLAPIRDFPAAKIKPKDLIFVAAPENAPAAAKTEQAAVKATPVTAPEQAVTTVIEAPQNVDERRTPPTLYTPEEQAERARKAAEKQKKKQQ
jgi:hypothetical protein